MMMMMMMAALLILCPVTVSLLVPPPETPHLNAKTMTESWHCQKITLKNPSLKKETWETWKEKSQTRDKTEESKEMSKQQQLQCDFFQCQIFVSLPIQLFQIYVDVSLPTLLFVDVTPGCLKLRDLWFLIRFLYFPIANCFMHNNL